MSSYAGIYINGKEVFSYRNEVRSEVMGLFSSNELLHLKGRGALAYASGWYVEEMSNEEIEEELEVFVYRVPAALLKDRLSVLGFGEPLVKEVFEELLDQERASLRRGPRTTPNAKASACTRSRGSTCSIDLTTTNGRRRSAHT
jgi:hypothetical protein